MSLANKITISRALLIPPIIVLLLVRQQEIALALFIIASLGDVLDGIAARKRHEVSTIGKVLDPAVDKLLYAGLVSSLYFLGTIPLLSLFLFFIPQVGLGVGALFLHRLAGRVQGARAIGKTGSVLTFIAVALMMADVSWGIYAFYIAVGITYIAGIDYLIAAVRTTHQE